MSSWKIVTCLGLLVSLISISKQHCSDYFNMSDWTSDNLMESFNLVLADDPKDIIQCTLKKLCDERNILCHLLTHCFTGSKRTLKCESESSQTIDFYHLHCMVAIEATPKVVVPKRCKYENVCKLYSKISPYNYRTTTTTTTAATIHSTTAAAAAAATASSSITAATAAPVPSGANTLKDAEKRSTDNGYLTLILVLFVLSIVSVILNVLLVFYCLKLRRSLSKMDTVDGTECEIFEAREDTSLAAAAP